VRTHTQAKMTRTASCGYRVYAGHIDWVTQKILDDDRFSFSVLGAIQRNELLLSISSPEVLKPQASCLNENTGKRNILPCRRTIISWR
jgi:hypothetical protein